MLKELSYYSEFVGEGVMLVKLIVCRDEETGEITDMVEVQVIENREAVDVGSSYVNYRWWIEGKVGHWRVGRLFDAHAQARWPSRDMTESGALSGQGA